MSNRRTVTKDPTIASIIVRISKELPEAFSPETVEKAKQTLIEEKDTRINESHELPPTQGPANR